ncbi:hypothetical protein QZQ41_20585 [Serratia marcescens]|uniref:hypothetical protein n=1 Tax=Serratia marcescens TaxID=615 RepID=UPI002769EC68|nr:hypothetical protein [Serratia marcescens]MDP8616930.1 hypothetical protein [Serratia marcescens]MDP8656982.1 hypothetical protein [Serratia marcescens]MDP8661967.1 hypothetical protein [Serratia marcescens]MDP8721207.1 hypothetical protein [Serratia marcescens]
MSTKPVMKSSTLDILKAQLKNSLNKQVEESKEKAAATKIEKAKTAGELLEELIANHAAGKAGRTIKSRGIALCAAVQGGPANNRPDALLMKSKNGDGRRRVWINKAAGPEGMKVTLIRKANGSIVAPNGYRLAQATIDYMERVGMVVTIEGDAE